MLDVIGIGSYDNSYQDCPKLDDCHGTRVSWVLDFPNECPTAGAPAACSLILVSVLELATGPL